MLWDERSERSKVDIANEDQEDEYGQRCEKAYNFSRVVCRDNFGTA